MAATATSPRERRLWRLTALVVVGIAASIPLAPTVAETLVESGLVVTGFWVGIWLVTMTVVVLGLGVRPRGVELGAALGLAAVLLLLLVRVGSAAERSHLIEYGVLAAFILEALRERTANGRPVRHPALLAIGAAATIGVLDEAVQWLVRTRVGSWVDVAFDVVAATMAVTAGVALTRVRDRRAPSP